MTEEPETAKEPASIQPHLANSAATYETGGHEIESDTHKVSS
jgi:hypothetical protein